jgi:hypothetical protein
VASGLLLGIEWWGQNPIEEWAWGLPLVYGFLGGFGGLLGLGLWSPLPDLHRTPAAASPLPAMQVDLSINWPRLIIGLTLVLVIQVWVGDIRTALVKFGASAGRTGGVPNDFLSWGIATLGLLIASGFAGTNTTRGLFPGGIVGFLAGVGVLVFSSTTEAPGYHAHDFILSLFGTADVTSWPASEICIIASSTVIGLVGGSSGAQLFPAVPQDDFRPGQQFVRS